MSRMNQKSYRILPKMCTTAVFGKNATADGSVLMASSEDDEKDDKNPCRRLVYHPRKRYPEGAVLKLTAETIEQVPTTYAYYSIDANMVQGEVVNGINEHGVALTTNTIFTKEQCLEKGGISVVEKIKLVLERCRTTKEGVELITGLQDRYGGIFDYPEWSGMAFVIADSAEAWVVETTPRHWAAKRCPDDGAFFYANEMLLQGDYDMASTDLVSYAVEKGWHNSSSGSFSFKGAYGERLEEDWNLDRMYRTGSLLSPRIGTVTVEDLMAFLRDHYEGTGCNYHYPPHAYLEGGHYTICNAETHDAEIWHLRNYMPSDIGCVMWCCMCSPCENLFQPIWAGAEGETPHEYNVCKEELDLSSAWWATRSLQRMVDRDYENRIKLIKSTWKQREDTELRLSAEREMLAMLLWQSGNKDEAKKLLTDLQNAFLHGNYRTALNLLGI